MQKLFWLSGALMIVALLCIVAGIVSKNGAVFTGIGAFWFIMAIIVGARYSKKPPGDKP